APAGDRPVALEDGDEDRTGAHEAHQVGEERPRAVDGVEALGVRGREREEARRDRREPALLDHREDAADHAPFHRVRLDDAERAFLHWRSPPFRRTACMLAPSSAGLGASVTPACRKAAIFSAAVPLPPAMMAPAWPMRLPLGAVWPAMKPTTGFCISARMNAAASSSAEPPISPIMITAAVPASSPPTPTPSTNPLPI